jgi:uncharacterized protein YdeI (YjbR/CyaY-like superfamily)
MDYCAISVPASVTKTLGTKSAVLVMAKVRKEADLKEGDRVRVRITVLDRADITIPKDLAGALRAEGAAHHFNALSAGKKNYMIRKIDDASKPATRAKRV